MSRTILGDVVDQLQATSGEPPTSVPPFQRGDKRKPRVLSWLWRDKISLGTITLLIGEPEQGKSLITCDMAARVTTGKDDWPDAATKFGPRDVVILAAEDPTDEILLPRLKAAGADLARVYVLPMEETFLLDDTKYMRRLRWLMFKHHPALIVIDPLDDYISKWTDSGQSQSVRLGLKELKHLAAQYHVAVVCILHLNKREDLPALKRALGSVAFGALARSALAVAKDDKGEHTYFGTLKTNYAGKGTKGTALRYAIDAVPHPDDPHPEDPDETIARIKWEGDYVVDIAALLEKKPTEARPSASKLEEAAAFLAHELGDHLPHPSTPLKGKATAARIAPETLRRARETRKVETKYVQGLGWCWQLPSSGELTG